MEALLAGAGETLADRWLGLISVPAAAFTAAAVTGILLGQGTALDVAHLNDRLAAAGSHVAHRPAAIVVAIALGLVAVLVAALLAEGSAGLIRILWLGQWPWPLRSAADRRARTRNTRAAERQRKRSPDVKPVEAYFPHRATWIGDRIALAGVRIDAQYGLDIVVAWPRLWLLLPQQTRDPITAANTRFAAAIAAAGWAVLYLLLGIRWWPAAGIAVILGLLAWRRGRRAADEFATLLEAAIDTHQRAIAEALGVSLPHQRITPHEGVQINDILHKGG